MPTLPKHKAKPWVAVRDKRWRPRRDAFNNPISRSDPQYVRFYASKRWRSLRNYYISMNPLCEECERNGFITPGQDVDHIKPMRLGGAMTSLDNLQTLCKSCHNRKTARESRKNINKNKIN
jgi:5-methylcytosine-specific restriction endonuclease McrA